MSVFVGGMGVATGIVFDDENNLYVGDRSGTVSGRSVRPGGGCFRDYRALDFRFTISRGDRTSVISGVSGPTRLPVFDTIYRVADNGGDVETFYRGWAPAGHGLRCVDGTRIRRRSYCERAS